MTIINEFLQIFKTRTAKQAGYIFVSSVVAKFVSFLAMVLLVRNFSIAQYGMISTALSISSLFSGLLFAGLNTTMVRYGALYVKDSKNKASLVFSTTFWSEILAALLLLVLGWLLSPYIAQHVFDKEFLTPFIRAGFAIGLGTVLTNYAFSFFQTHERFKRYSALTISYSFLIFGSIYAFAKLGILTPTTTLIIYISVPLIVFIFASRFILKQGLLAKIDMTLFKEMWGFGKWVILGSFFTMIYGQFPVMILARYETMEEVGLFSFAYNIYMALLLVPAAINTVIFPKIVKLKTKKEMHIMLNRILRITTSCSLIFIPLLLASKQIIYLIAGGKYVDAVLPLNIFVVGAMLFISMGTLGYFLLTVNRSDVQAATNLIGMILNVIVGLLIIPKYGAIGAAIVTVLSITAVCVIQMSFVLKVVNGDKNGS